MTRDLIAALVLGGCSITPAFAVGDADHGELLYQRECARCHGPAAQGGKQGEYPRLAGLSAGYIEQQLKNFASGKRRNKPMLPIFKAGRLPVAEIEAVSRYLSGLEPPSPDEIGIPQQVDADLDLGEELYVTDCALCHGHDGNGKVDTDNPPLVRQYPHYIVKQMKDFRSQARWHEYGEALFEEAEPEELEAMLGYILRLNRHAPEPAEIQPTTAKPAASD